MPIKYEKAGDLQEQIKELAGFLFPHVRLDSVVCLRSFGSTSRGTIARCHALGKAMQLALGRKGFYVIEVIHSRFDKLSEEDKIKTLIHELMHIPKSFGGGFIHHNIVHEDNVDKMYEKYTCLKKGNADNSNHINKNFKNNESHLNNNNNNDYNNKFSNEADEDKRIEEVRKKKRFFDVDFFRFT